MDKKALTREYKETQRPMGVYQVRNTVNGKVLIGTSVDLPAILNRFNKFQPGMQVATIDHVMWFHLPFRVDDWLLYAIDSPSSSGARNRSRRCRRTTARRNGLDSPASRT